MKAITAGRFGSSQATVQSTKLTFALYSVKLYETRTRQSDGAVTWRFVRHLSNGHTYLPTVKGMALDKAADLGLPYIEALVHGAVEIPAPEPLVECESIFD